MIERATGIILRTRPLTETSLIVNWLTPDLGRISTVAKGARRSKSPFRGKLDLFYEADFSFQRSRRSELHALREVRLSDTHTAFRAEMGYLQQASYCATLIEQATERETPLPEIYELLRSFLATLAQHLPRAETVFAFELKLLHESGLAPEPGESRLTPGAAIIVKKLTAQDWNSLSRLKASEPQIRELQQFLHGFLLQHLGKIPGNRLAALGATVSF